MNPGNSYPRPERSSRPVDWSIMGGEFHSSENFPDPDRLNEARAVRTGYDKEELREPLYFSDLLMHALEASQPELLVDRPTRLSISLDIREVAVFYLNQFHPEDREESLKKLTFRGIEPRDVPIMRAIKEYTAGGVSQEDINILNGIVRAIWSRQFPKGPPSL